MKIILSILLTLCWHCSMSQNSVMGIWEGILKLPQQELKLIFTFNEKNGHSTALLNVPQQSPISIPADSVNFNSQEAYARFKKFKIEFSGTLINDTTISGTFLQGASFPIILIKTDKIAQAEIPARPQTPKPPFPYKVKEIDFYNADKSIHYAGTLTCPDDKTRLEKYPAVLLISGSGPQNRDEEIFGHKPFAIIADYLTRKGMVVLRVDDRGVGKTTGTFAGSTTLDFMHDAMAAFDFLKQQPQVNKKYMGIIGHSEGGMIAEMMGAKRSDVDFIILLAAPGIRNIDLMAAQNVAIFKSKGVSAAAAENYGNLFKLMCTGILQAKTAEEAEENTVKNIIEWNAPVAVKKELHFESLDTIRLFASSFVNEVNTIPMRYFLAYDPMPNFKKIKSKVLALNGSKDIQVLPDPNLAGIQQGLKHLGKKKLKIQELPGLNHLFQTCKVCNLDEYVTLEESFSPLALEAMGDWLQQQNIITP